MGTRLMNTSVLSIGNINTVIGLQLTNTLCYCVAVLTHTMPSQYELGRQRSSGKCSAITMV